MHPLTEIPLDAEPVLHDLPMPGEFGWEDSDTTCVYFIQEGEGGPYKIGVSTLRSLIGRLKSIQLGNPRTLHIRRVVLGSYGLEALLHKRYAEHRIHREWFHPHPEIVAIAAPDRPDMADEIKRLREARQKLRARQKE